MKRYTIKNYKGNLLESLKRFAKSHKGMRIVEAVEDENNLKLKTEESEKTEKINEATGKKVYVLVPANEPYVPNAIYTSLEAAKKGVKEHNSDQEDYPSEYAIYEFELDNNDYFTNNKEIVKKIK